MVDLPECPHNTGVVNTGDKNGEQVGEESRLLLEVESQGLVIARRDSQYGER